MPTNIVFAAGLTLLAAAPSPVVMFAGWAVIGLGMGIGLCEFGFATLVGIYDKDACGPISGITLIAGFSSTAVAIAAGALIGPAQVAARVLEFGLLRRSNPLVASAAGWNGSR